MQRSNSQMKWRSYFWNTFVLMELWNSWVDFANPILFCERSPDNNCHFRVTGDFSDIFQPIIMTLFTWSLFSISGVMLIIQVDIVKYSLDFFVNLSVWLRFFWLFTFFHPLISVASWKRCACIAIDFQWIDCIGSGVHCLWNRSTNYRCIR